MDTSREQREIDYNTRGRERKAAQSPPLLRRPAATGVVLAQALVTADYSWLSACKPIGRGTTRALQLTPSPPPKPAARRVSPRHPPECSSPAELSTHPVRIPYYCVFPPSTAFFLSTATILPHHLHPASPQRPNTKVRTHPRQIRQAAAGARLSLVCSGRKGKCSDFQSGSG
jgi:hypothetical protein